MTADYLFLDFGHSRFATEKRTARSNLVQYKDRWKGTWVRRLPDPAAPRVGGAGAENVFATQSGCIYSSFGLAEIFFDLDNLYQAAGYRLASQLVQSRWIGSPAEHPQNVLQEWATRDLLYPQRLADQAEPPPSFHPDAIAGRAVVSNDGDWLALLEFDLQNIEQKEGEEAAAGLGSIVATHRDRLAAGGEARNTIAQNVATWTGTPTVLGPWRRRLQFLGDRHLSEHGVEATKLILVEYRATLLDVRQNLVEAQPGQLGPSLLSRLDEAGSVPFPVRQIALRIELAKARGEARTELNKHYSGVAQADAEPAVLSAIRYVGEPGRGAQGRIAQNLHGTLQEWMNLAGKRLEAISNRLKARFEVASKGRDLVNQRKQSLTVVWDENKYDQKINQALVVYDMVGRDPRKPEGSVVGGDLANFEFEFDWAKLEKLVLGEKLALGELGPDVPTDSIAELLRYWETNQLVNQENVEKIAQRLAEACEAVLRDAALRLADVQNGNVADLLMIDKNDVQRRQMIEQLIISTAPYLPITNRHGDAIQPANHNLFGLSVGGQATSRGNADAITELVRDTAAARQAGGVANFGERLEAEQSSALFVRMMAGFPLQDYTRLEELYKAYKDPATNTRSNDECHVDYKQSWEDLPDIRAVGPETYAQVRESIDIVLLNMMIGVINYPKDRAAFYVLIPDPYGAGEDYHRLGKRISRSIKHACDDETIRNYLADRWSQWSADASVKAWACLYESGLRTLNESRRDIAVEAGRSESVPFRTCYGGLLRMIGKKLSEVEGGSPWLEALKPRPAAEGDGDGRPRARPAGLDGALKRIHESLKIYQLIPSKVESVALPEPDVVAPTA